jgi:hypothetical protein
LSVRGSLSYQRRHGMARAQRRPTDLAAHKTYSAKPIEIAVPRLVPIIVHLYGIDSQNNRQNAS